MSDYLFTKCLNPRGIFNPYIREWVSVPCGHCKACLLNKSAYYKSLTTLEALSNNVTYFVTLTYSNDFIPRCYPVQNDDCVTSSLVDSDTGEVLSTVSNSSIPSDLFEKLRSEYIPYLLKEDVQLFLKRLRKEYAKSKNSIRYFAVGEYGPKHFRPHYHLLLWFSRQTSVSELAQIISEKWIFGRVDVQKAKGDAARYVTGYANSFSFVPHVLRTFKSGKPFCLHSNRLGEKMLPFSTEEILFNAPEETSRIRVTDGERIKEFRLWRSYILRHVPRCIGYACKTSSARYRSYCIYAEARKRFSHTCVMDLAEQIYHYVNMANYNYNSRKKYKVIYDYFRDLFPNPEYYLHYTQKDKVEKIINRIYRELLISKRFCTIAETIDIDDGSSVFSSFSSRYDALFHFIERYYSRKELNTLNEFYRKLEKFSYEQKQYIEIDNLYSIIYNQRYEEKIIGTPLFNKFAYDIDIRFADSIKHKAQNDANNIMFNS